MFVGTDIGRGSTVAVYGENPSDVISFLSYAMPGKERDMLSSGNFIDNLDVYINGEEWFIGPLAQREGATKEFSKDKAKHGNIKPLLITSLALAARQISQEVVVPKLVVGLPINDYRKQADILEKSLVGSYSVMMPDRRETFINLMQKNVIAFPECVAAGEDLLLNGRGKLADEKLSKLTFCIGDIGWKTFNFCVFRGLNFQNSKSGTLPLGLSVAFTEFYKRISRQRDITMSKAEELLFTEGRQELIDLTKKIQDAVSVFWADILDEIDEMYLCGYVAPKMIEHFSWNWKLHPNHVIANASGYFKVARQQFAGAVI